MARADLKYHGLVSGLADGREPRLQLITETGKTVREVPLTRRDLVQLIRSAAGALDVLDRQEAKK